MITNHKIQGKRLYLRSIKESDASENYINWLNDTNVNRFLETRFVEQNLKSRMHQSLLFWKINF